VLEISGVRHVYPGGVVALDGIDLTIGRGLFGLLGPNGAGKSTLMRLIATLQRPSTGRIRFDGIDVAADPRAIRRQLGYLPQDFGVYPNISAEKLLDHMAVLKGIGDRAARRREVDRLLALTNLAADGKRAVATFSGGMKRRFGVAQALIGAPRLIVVDEPTAGLDPEERDRFHELLADIGADAVVILSTHIVEDVANLCSEMAILAGGRIRLTGAPAALIAGLEGRLWAIEQPRDAPVPAEAISARLASGARRVHVVADSAPGPGWAPARPGLEDVYFETLRTCC
jgi:ABC-type multidrug transport system ATPase subunit